MQVRTVVVRMPDRIKVVVAAGESCVQRTADSSLLTVELPVVMIVFARVDLGPATEDLEAVDEAVLATRELFIQSRQNSFIESDASRRSQVPAVSRPPRLSAWLASTQRNDCEGEHGDQKDPRHVIACPRQVHPALPLLR